MTTSRKDFLKSLSFLGVGTLLSFPTGISFWRKHGMRLTSVQRESLVMGSIISIEAVCEPGKEQDGYQAIGKALEVFRRIDRKLSMYDNQSETGKLGKYAGRQPVKISKDTKKVLSTAQNVYYSTEGRFDVTIEPVMKEWGFRKSRNRTIARPTDQEIKKLQSLVGMDKLHVHGYQAFLEKKGMGIDLGGIAGGFALDLAIQKMKHHVPGAMINFSGDIHCFGQPPNDHAWKVRLVDPVTLRPQQEPVELTNKALSTSGAYQNRRRGSSGRSWGHLIAPEGARPVHNTTGSITAIHPSAMSADVWSTAAYLGATPPDDVKIIELEAPSSKP